jgi:uncharacterized damage-inducible protein DinB
MQNPFSLLASYNEWMNAKVYETAAQLSTEELTVDKGAFFGSVFGTLNHIAVGDRIWLRRFAEHPSEHQALQWIRKLPQPRSLDEVLYAEFSQLAEHRRALDEAIMRWAGSLTDEDLNATLSYTNVRGVKAAKQFASVVLHFFNHQTHHRGQVTTLLSQFGKDVGVTDLLVLIKNDPEAVDGSEK